MHISKKCIQLFIILYKSSKCLVKNTKLYFIKTFNIKQYIPLYKLAISVFYLDSNLLFNGFIQKTCKQWMKLKCLMFQFMGIIKILCNNEITEIKFNKNHDQRN